MPGILPPAIGAYEPFRPVGDIDDSEDPWGMTVSLGVGDALAAPSRRRSSSIEPDMPPCIGTSSPGGEIARLLCPAVWYSARPMALSIYSLLIPDVSSIGDSVSSGLSSTLLCVEMVISSGIEPLLVLLPRA